jgi:hypothetical protein
MAFLISIFGINALDSNYSNQVLGGFPQYLPGKCWDGTLTFFLSRFKPPTAGEGIAVSCIMTNKCHEGGLSKLYHKCMDHM